MRYDTRIDWHRKVDKALIMLLDTLDEAPDFRRISDELAASPYHFHKQFKYLTGETFKACADRLRLEKAAAMLRSGRKSITDVAFACGYSTAEMFSKAVRKAWGMSPSALRRQSSWHPNLPSSVGVHYTGKNKRVTWFYAKGDKKAMETKIVHFDEKLFFGYEIVGDYWQLPQAWEKFHAAAEEHGLYSTGKEFMSVFPDNSPETPAAERRAFAGCVVGSEPVDSFDLTGLRIPAGLYAVTVHFGSSEAIGPVWDKWVKEWLPASGWEPDYSRPNYEWYQNRSDNPELLLTFLVSSVKRSAAS